MGFFDRFRRDASTASSTPGASPTGWGGPEPGAAGTAVQDLERLAGGADRICVVDCETTGIYPTDRVVELAIVTLSLEGSVIETWDTLIHPRRDVGATHIHGLTAAILEDAPTFADVAGDVALRLHGACLAAHNLPFDRRMLAGEFSRLGGEFTVLAGIDTLTATRCRLGSACASYGITLRDAHSALADATATAQLLVHVAAHCQTGGPAAVPAGLVPSGRARPRSAAAPVLVPEPPFLAALAASLDLAGLEADMLAYLELVARAVVDLHLDAHERAELNQLARDLGLDDAHRAQAHRRFVNDLIDAALEDHIVTAEELDLLLRVATALDVDTSLVEQRTRPALDAAVSVRLEPGLEIVFTGDDPDRPRPELTAHATALGCSLGKGVTKRTDILVAFDPASSSGKAAKARNYGIPILSTSQFAAARVGDAIEAKRSALDAMKVVTCPDCHVTWTVSARSAARTTRRCEECSSIVGAMLADQDATPSTAPVDEVLVCEGCGRSWSRERTRGRKPARCPACR
jgi:DNA polymerase-3 subunit epsilon